MAYKTSSLHYRSKIEAKVFGNGDDDMAIQLEFRVTEWFTNTPPFHDFNLAQDTWYFSIEEAKTIINELQKAITSLNPPSLNEVPTAPEFVPQARVVVSSAGLSVELGDYDKHALDEDSGSLPLS